MTWVAHPATQTRRHHTTGDRCMQRRSKRSCSRAKSTPSASRPRPPIRSRSDKRRVRTGHRPWPLVGAGVVCGDPWPTPIRIENPMVRTRARPRPYPTIRSSGPTPVRSPTGGTEYSAGPRPPEDPRTCSHVWKSCGPTSSCRRKVQSSRVRCVLLSHTEAGEVRCPSWGRWTGADEPNRGSGIVPQTPCSPAARVSVVAAREARRSRISRAAHRRSRRRHHDRTAVPGLADALDAARSAAPDVGDPDLRDSPAPWSPSVAAPTRHSSLDPRGVLRSGLGITREMLAAVPTLVRAGYHGLTEERLTLPLQSPPTIFNAPTGRARKVAARSWPLKQLRRLSACTGAPLDVVVLTLCAGALRAYLLEQYALPEVPLTAMLPSRSSARAPPSGRAATEGSGQWWYPWPPTRTTPSPAWR